MRPSRHVLVMVPVFLLLSLEASATQSVQAGAPGRPAPAAGAPLTLPAPIEAAFRRAYPAASVTHVSREKQGAMTVYEVESVDAGRGRDIVYRLDGTVVETEEELTAADVPALVQSALAARYPKATIVKREKLTKGTVVSYELQLKGARVVEVVLSPEGKWISPAPAR